MAAIKQLAAVTRSGIGKGAARSVRREGRVPGVIYGGGEKAEPISERAAPLPIPLRVTAASCLIAAMSYVLC